MTRRPRRGRVEAGHIVAGLALAALLLHITSLVQVLTHGSP